MTETKKLSEDLKVGIIKEILERYNLSPQTFCLAPYMHLDYDQSGEMHSCFEGKSKMGNWRTNSVFEQFNNEEYQKLRKSHRIGDIVSTQKNCETCYTHEDHNVYSHRLRNLVDKYNIMGHARFESLIETLSKADISSIEPNNLDHVEMRLSNFCNLRCMHCDHRSSTQWLNFYTNQENIDKAREVGIAIHPDANAENIMQFFNDHQHSTAKHFDEIVKTLQNSKLITFSGGEPLLDPYYKPLMDEIVKSKNCSTKSLDIHSNLNIKDITAYFDHWKKFKKVSIYVSIDCPPSTYKYFRRNGDWNLVASNIKKIKNECSQVSVIGHLTFSLFGALRYKEIADTWEDMALEPNSSIVILGPTSSRYLSDPLKQSALSQMNEVLQNKDGKYSNGLVRMTDKCKTYLLNTESYGENIHHEVIGWCKLHDKKTNLQTLDFYPELKMYYNNNNVK